MTPSVRVSIVVVAVLLVAGAAAAQKPPEVPRLVDRHLDDASYVELAKQWKAYIDQNGETPEALVNLGLAYDYSEEHDAALTAARRAVELGPDDPAALAFLGKMLTTWKSDEEAAIEVLEHCREVAPDYRPGLESLAATYLRRGEFREANDVFKAMFDQRVLARPLQDFAYNLLVGLPQDAVLITGGDNDTFPPLALQAGMDFRTDVIVLNRSLLNLPSYCKALFDAHPGIRPDYDVDAHEVKMVDGQPTILANAVLRQMITEGKAPLYFAASADYDRYGFDPEGELEGLDLRVAGKGKEMGAEKSAKLFLDSYRLDSATDWNFAWSVFPTVGKLMQNYVVAMIKLAQEKGVDKETRSLLLERAAAIADFHEMDRWSITIEKLQKK